ncbi:unnamed protein product [Cuscuta campestris]|uniref:FBD domain-containing protein n=1 Tax=Cuscuta campestris TaxID=132261 RepID=A0A484LF31_9ASTE|nr:unnamed protein product [Cuscuta campestris]
MDTCSPASKLRRKQLNEKEDGTCSWNRSLNDLPDAILGLILSFLSTKCAVQTSVLCKRWQYMWTSLPVLDFDVSGRKGLEKGHPWEKKMVSEDFVDRVLIFHDAPRIHKFTLYCRVRNDISRIRTWISAAVRRKPQEVAIIYCDLNVHENDQHMLPHCLFSSEETEVLRLAGCYRLLLPSQICLPRLRTLTLEKLTFIDYRPLNLLFGGPALEKLVIDECRWKGDAFEVSISAPKLRHLTIEEFYDEDDTTEFDSRSVTISSPELNVFHYVGGFFKSYHFDCPSSISNASLGSPHGTPLEDLRTDHLNEVLSALQSVEYLELAAYFVEAFTHASVPIFKSLSSLVLTEEPANLSCRELEKMHNKFPRLKTLTFMAGITAKSSGRLFKSKLTCLSSTLKRIAIHGFRGTTGELFAVQFLLWKATCLERMDIYWQYCNVGEYEQNETGLFLSASHRSSKSCELHVGK